MGVEDLERKMKALLVGDGDQPVQKNPTLPKELESYISKELMKLSLKARNGIDEEVHGVCSLCPDENPEFIDSALLELSAELDRIPDNSPPKAAYMASQKFPDTYVNSTDFRLRFLRCELFDAKKAALRLVRFLSFASELFGPEVLQRPILYSDLTKEEDKIFRKGYIQQLPYRDRAGRIVFAWVGDFELATHAIKRVRVGTWQEWDMSF